MEAKFNPRHLSKNDLAAQALRAFGVLHLGVTGSSMLPAIRPADRLLIRHCHLSEAKLHDIVLFTRHRRLFVHRVVSRSPTHLITQGDGMAEPDGPVAAHELLGKVVQVKRQGKTIPHAAQPAWPARLAAVVFRRSPLTARLLNRLHSLPGRASL